MRAVWSFWTKPFLAHNHSMWRSQAHHLYSWVLSLETVRQHFSRTAVFTDDEGARLLIDKLGLEFDEVSTELNALAQHDPGWWALGKVWTYRAQSEPFIHFDNDAFLWNPLPDLLISAPVIAQNPDVFLPGFSYYEPEALERTVSKGGQIWLPAEWVWYRSVGTQQRGISCGIFGGNRVDFIQHYSDQAIKLIEHPANQAGWSLMKDKFNHNILFEQYLLGACIEYHQRHTKSPFRDIEVRYMFESIDKAFDQHLAEQMGYTHLLAGAKRNPDIAERLEQRVKRDYPAHYERCLSINSLSSSMSS
jgi:hypothetical protein